MAGAEFEIQTNRSGRWQIEGVQGAQADAIAIAKKLLGTPGVEGVKVFKETKSRFGRGSQELVFEQAGPAKDSGIITVGTIEAAPARCEKPNDLFRGGARQTMAKLLKNYTAKMNLTVGEILYNGRELKRVMERDNLLSSAVSRVATLQSAQDKQNANARRDELFKMIETVAARANAVEKVQLPSIAKVGIAGLEQDVAARATEQEQRDYLMRVAISRELMNAKSFLGKLENAVGWADDTHPAVQVAALDDFIADTLANPTVIRDVLGQQDNLLAAIQSLLDLVNGQFVIKPAPGAKPEDSLVAERLNKLIAAGRLPGAIDAISDHVQSMLAGRNPLVREGTPKQENEALRTLVERLVPTDGPLRTRPEILLALIERTSRVLNVGGDSGRNAAVGHIVRLLVEPARRVRFLLVAYLASPTPAITAHVAELLRTWIDETRTATSFYPDASNPAAVMRSATNLFYEARDAGLPAELTQPLMGHIEKLLYDWIEKEQILKMLDDPTKPLRPRAMLLISMCLPEVLPPGKAVEAARTRVVGYLRQPDFMVQVVADLTDPAENEKALRELFSLMQQAGFK